jgi:hypothetical protein
LEVPPLKGKQVRKGKKGKRKKKKLRNRGFLTGCPTEDPNASIGVHERLWSFSIPRIVQRGFDSIGIVNRWYSQSVNKQKKKKERKKLR